jgi:DNA-binding MarR family transcriptional regulator
MALSTGRQVGVADGNVVLDLFVLQQRIGELMESALDGTGVRPAEYAVLSQLGVAAMTPRDLRARLGVTPSTLTGHLAALERHGYVRRTANPADGRSSVVELSADGRATLTRCRRGFRRMLATLEAALPVPADDLRATLLRVDEAAAAAITALA